MSESDPSPDPIESVLSPAKGSTKEKSLLRRAVVLTDGKGEARTHPNMAEAVLAVIVETLQAKDVLKNPTAQASAMAMYMHDRLHGLKATKQKIEIGVDIVGLIQRGAKANLDGKSSEDMRAMMSGSAGIKKAGLLPVVSLNDLRANSLNGNGHHNGHANGLNGHSNGHIDPPAFEDTEEGG